MDVTINAATAAFTISFLAPKIEIYNAGLKAYIIEEFEVARAIVVLGAGLSLDPLIAGGMG